MGNGKWEMVVATSILYTPTHRCSRIPWLRPINNLLYTPLSSPNSLVDSHPIPSHLISSHSSTSRNDMGAFDVPFQHDLARNTWIMYAVGMTIVCLRL